MLSAERLSTSASVISLLTAGFVLTLEAQPSPVGAQVPTAAHRALVNRYCVSCHNARLKNGGLALDEVNEQDIERHPDVWEKVVRKLHVRQMPPVGLPRPDDASYDAEISLLEASLDAAAAAAPNPGRTATLRRLTRTEYQNAVRDLL